MIPLLYRIDQAIIMKVAEPSLDVLGADPKEAGKFLFLGCLAIYLCGVFAEFQHGALDAVEIVKAGVLIALTLANLPLLSLVSSRASRLGLWRMVRLGCLFLAIWRLLSAWVGPMALEIVLSALSLSLLVSALYAAACDRPPPRRRRLPMRARAAATP
jgi:hypothetical protein